MRFNTADPAAYIEELHQLTESLTKIVLDETEALKARRPLALKDTQDERDRLTKIYSTHMAKIQKSPSFLKRAPKPLREKLARATHAFHAALDTHQRTLGAMKTVTERMVEAIAREAQKISKPAGTYGRNAGYASVGHRAKPFAVNSLA